MSSTARSRPLPHAVGTALLGLFLALGALVMVPLATAPAAVGAGSGYAPPAGPRFNNPLGSRKAERRLLNQVIRTVDSARHGSRIRMAVFSFGDTATADALIRAYRRGVRVKLVFAGANAYPAMRRLQKVIGRNTSAPSFVTFCTRSCRGDGGEMHAKYFSFSRAGSARWVTTVGSVNLTRHNAENQWNDLYTVLDDRDYFRAYRKWFTQLKKDRPFTPAYREKSVGARTISFTPLDLSVQQDPVRAALDKVRCLVPRSEIDRTLDHPNRLRRTKVYLAAHAWNGERGKSLAWRVAALQQGGCRVKVYYGVGMGGAVKSILGNRDVKLRKGRHAGVRTHEKVMIVEGGFDGEASTARAWTGSHNWSDRALRRDDLFLQINDPEDAAKYASKFRFMWERG